MSNRFLAAALLASLAAVPAASETTPGQPTGNWVVDFDDAQCVASRGYGSSETPVTFALKAPALGNVMQIVVIRPGRGSELAEHWDATILIDGRDRIRTTMVYFVVPDVNQRLFRINLPLDQFEALKTARQVTIRGARLNEQFNLTGMPSLLKVMDDCVADLRRVWNITEKEEQNPNPNLNEAASGSLAGLFKSDDYPGIAIMRDMQGRVTFALLIDESGSIADCTVIETSGVAALDAQSCAIVKERAKFRPAIGLDGKPTKSGLVQTVSWKIKN